VKIEDKVNFDKIQFVGAIEGKLVNIKNENGKKLVIMLSPICN